MEPLNVADFERLAAERLPQMVYDYYAGGADDEVTVRENQQAWQRLALRPRCLMDVTQRDLSTTVLGTRVSMPILTAPCGFNALAHPDGELAVARAVAAADTIQCVSTAATYSLEEVAAAVPEGARFLAEPDGTLVDRWDECNDESEQSRARGVRWFQLYCYKDRSITQALVERAAAAGYRAVVLTVDAPYVGHRERDIRNRFGLPPGLRWKNLEPYGFDRMDAGGDGSALVKYIESIWDAGLTWDAIDWLRSISPLPVVLKGILTAEDARIAAGHGVEGIIVSNHGGRQLDGAVTTAAALAEVVDAVGDAVEVYVDSGIRRGSDVLKALALGARAALIGRPYLWGLAVDGEAGVSRVLSLLRAELDLSLALSGLTRVRNVPRELLHQPRPSGMGS